MHYWYDISATMDCKQTFPVFLLYNKNRLNGFGWAFNPDYKNSDKWEHPTKSQFPVSNTSIKVQRYYSDGDLSFYCT